MDEDGGWTQFLKLRLEESGEVLEIGPSTEGKNMIEVEKETETVVTPRPIRKDDAKTSIPRVIMQTGYLIKDNIRAMNTTRSFLFANPGYRYVFFENAECLAFMRKHFPENVEDYLRLRPGAFRADLFRYCFLFIHGGCYFDHKLICRMSIDNVLRDNDELVLCGDWDYIYDPDSLGDLYNAVIMVRPQHPLMRNAIDQCIFNIRHRLYLDGAFSITGPTLLKRCYASLFYKGRLRKIIPPEDVVVRFKHFAYHPWTSYRNMVVIDRAKNKVFVQKSCGIVVNPRSGEYHNMYRDKKVYNEYVKEVQPGLYHVSMRPDDPDKEVIDATQATVS
jgi:mannosyltransferase OCH1-like enzyme